MKVKQLAKYMEHHGPCEKVKMELNGVIYEVSHYTTDYDFNMILHCKEEANNGA